MPDELSLFKPPYFRVLPPINGIGRKYKDYLDLDLAPYAKQIIEYSKLLLEFTLESISGGKSVIHWLNELSMRVFFTISSTVGLDYFYDPDAPPGSDQKPSFQREPDAKQVHTYRVLDPVILALYLFQTRGREVDSTPISTPSV